MDQPDVLIEDVADSITSLSDSSHHHTSTMDIGVFPTEIWQIVCSHLDFKDLILLRLTSPGLADIAAEYLIKRIRFHTSLDSLERLRNIAQHKLLRKNVKTIVYEASLLADTGCIHSFFAHYDLDHHKNDKPQPPREQDKSDRASRLYERNLKKFEQDLTKKYKLYRTKYLAQQEFLQGPGQKLFTCLSSFPNLKELQLRTDARCHHVLSERFIEAFSKDCAVPLETDTKPTVWQLEYCLQTNLESFTARTISANFFNGCSKRPKTYVIDVFRSLKSIELVFRLDHQDAKRLIDEEIASPFKALDKGVLRDALGAAQDLQDLNITFVPGGISGPATDLKNIIGDYSWPKLKKINLDFVATTEDEFITVLQRQPKLDTLELGFCHLVEGEWTEALKRMRLDLKLKLFWTYGVLEDENRIFPVELCDREVWKDDREKLQLRMCIDNYVTDHDLPQFEDDGDEEVDSDIIYNPLHRFDDDFEDEDELIIQYGPVDGSDCFSSDLEDEMMGEDESDDESMASLIDLDIMDFTD